MTEKTPEISSALEVIQKTLQYHYDRSSHLRRNSYPSFFSLFPFLTPEVISFLGENPDGEISLCRLGSRVKGHFHYYQHLFRSRRLLPQGMLKDLWFKFLHSRSFLSNVQYSEVEGRKELVRIPPDPSESELELLSSLPLTDALLIDHPVVSFRMVQTRKPGWKFLRYMHECTWGTQEELPWKLQEAVRADQVEKFFISLDLTGVAVNFGVVMKVMKGKAWGILKTLLEKRMFEKGPEEITLEGLCCFCVSSLNNEEAVEALSVIEAIFPGVIKNTQDDFGRNLFWYTLDNRQISWFDSGCPLISFLISKGCALDNTNTLGLSWKFINDSMTPELKKQVLDWRPTYNI